jgi:hypothetical protein
MKRIATLILAAVVLFATAHQSPAPISEEPTPSPTVKPKPKSTESESSHISRSIRSFEGTWTGTVSSTGQDNTSRNPTAVFTSKKTLLISDRNAVVVTELTMARPAGGTWSDLPAAINASPLVVKITFRSNDLKSDSSNLTINWRPAQFSDWFPKEIPLNVRQKIESDFTKAFAAHPSTTYTLNGDELTGENAGVKTIYKRVK